MFKPGKHAKFFKTILKADDVEDVKDILIVTKNVTDLYGILMVIRLVLKGKIPMSKSDLELLRSDQKLFKLARLTW